MNWMKNKSTNVKSCSFHKGDFSRAIPLSSVQRGVQHCYSGGVSGGLTEKATNDNREDRQGRGLSYGTGRLTDDEHRGGRSEGRLTGDERRSGRSEAMGQDMKMLNHLLAEQRRSLNSTSLPTPKVRYVDLDKLGVRPAPRGLSLSRKRVRYVDLDEESRMRLDQHGLESRQTANIINITNLDRNSLVTPQNVVSDKVRVDESSGRDVLRGSYPVVSSDSCMTDRGSCVSGKGKCSVMKPCKSCHVITENLSAASNQCCKDTSSAARKNPAGNISASGHQVFHNSNRKEERVVGVHDLSGGSRSSHRESSYSAEDPLPAGIACSKRDVSGRPHSATGNPPVGKYSSVVEKTGVWENTCAGKRNFVECKGNNEYEKVNSGTSKIDSFPEEKSSKEKEKVITELSKCSNVTTRKRTEDMTGDDKENYCEDSEDFIKHLNPRSKTCELLLDRESVGTADKLLGRDNVMRSESNKRSYDIHTAYATVRAGAGLYDVSKDLNQPYITNNIRARDPFKTPANQIFTRAEIEATAHLAKDSRHMGGKPVSSSSLLSNSRCSKSSENQRSSCVVKESSNGRVSEDFSEITGNKRIESSDSQHQSDLFKAPAHISYSRTEPDDKVSFVACFDDKCTDNSSTCNRTCTLERYDTTTTSLQSSIFHQEDDQSHDILRDYRPVISKQKSKYEGQVQNENLNDVQRVGSRHDQTCASVKDSAYRCDSLKGGTCRDGEGRGNSSRGSSLKGSTCWDGGGTLRGGEGGWGGTSADGEGGGGTCRNGEGDRGRVKIIRTVREVTDIIEYENNEQPQIVSHTVTCGSVELNGSHVRHTIREASVCKNMQQQCMQTDSNVVMEGVRKMTDYCPIAESFIYCNSNRPIKDSFTGYNNNNHSVTESYRSKGNKQHPIRDSFTGCSDDQVPMNKKNSIRAGIICPIRNDLTTEALVSEPIRESVTEQLVQAIDKPIKINVIESFQPIGGMISSKYIIDKPFREKITKQVLIDNLPISEKIMQVIEDQPMREKLTDNSVYVPISYTVNNLSDNQSINENETECVDIQPIKMAEDCNNNSIEEISVQETNDEPLVNDVVMITDCSGVTEELNQYYTRKNESTLIDQDKIETIRLTTTSSEQEQELQHQQQRRHLYQTPSSSLRVYVQQQKQQQQQQQLLQQQQQIEQELMKRRGTCDSSMKQCVNDESLDDEDPIPQVFNKTDCVRLNNGLVLDQRCKMKSDLDLTSLGLSRDEVRDDIMEEKMRQDAVDIGLIEDQKHETRDKNVRREVCDPGLTEAQHCKDMNTKAALETGLKNAQVCNYNVQSQVMHRTADKTLREFYSQEVESVKNLCDFTEKSHDVCIDYDSSNNNIELDDIQSDVVSEADPLVRDCYTELSRGGSTLIQVERESRSTAEMSWFNRLNVLRNKSNHNYSYDRKTHLIKFSTEAIGHRTDQWTGPSTDHRPKLSPRSRPGSSHWESVKPLNEETEYNFDMLSPHCILSPHSEHISTTAYDCREDDLKFSPMSIFRPGFIDSAHDSSMVTEISPFGLVPDSCVAESGAGLKSRDGLEGKGEGLIPAEEGEGSNTDRESYEKFHSPWSSLYDGRRGYLF